jgi:hypothetical protein
MAQSRTVGRGVSDGTQCPVADPARGEVECWTPAIVLRCAAVVAVVLVVAATADGTAMASAVAATAATAPTADMRWRPCGRPGACTGRVVVGGSVRIANCLLIAGSGVSCRSGDGRGRQENTFGQKILTAGMPGARGKTSPWSIAPGPARPGPARPGPGQLEYLVRRFAARWDFACLQRSFVLAQSQRCGRVR